MRIVIVNSLYPPVQIGGAERSVSLLAEALVAGGDDVAVISLHPERKMTCEQHNGVRVYRLPVDNIYWPFRLEQRRSAVTRLVWHLRNISNNRAARRVGEILDRERPNVVHTNNLMGFSTAVWREVRKRGIRLVHTPRDYSLMCEHGPRFQRGHACERHCLECRLFSVSRKAASAHVDAVAAISGYVLRAHQEAAFFSGVPCFVIHNIADSSCRQEKPASREDSSSLVFGFIGRLEAPKGIQVALEATKHLANPNWRLKIAGTGREGYVAELKRRFADPRIEWLGFVAAKDYYPSIDVAIVPSVLPEPFSRVIIEAFSYSRSVICARSGGMPEVAQFGRTVGTYDAFDAVELASLMDKAIANPDSWRQGGFASDRARESFSASTITNLYRRVYRNDAD